MTGLKKDKSNPSMQRDKSQESVGQKRSTAKAKDEVEESVTPDQINRADVTQSQDEMRLNSSSPLEAPLDTALHT